jgi:hypothetical protein
MPNERDGLPPPRPPGVPTWRFSLKQMLLTVAVLCGIFALIGATAGKALVAVILAVLAVGAHVMAAILGARLRESATELAAWERKQQESNGPERADR